MTGIDFVRRRRNMRRKIEILKATIPDAEIRCRT